MGKEPYLRFEEDGNARWAVLRDESTTVKARIPLHVLVMDPTGADWHLRAIIKKLHTKFQKAKRRT